MMNFEEPFNLLDDNGIDMDIVAQIIRRRRQVLVLCYIDYRMNQRIVSDDQYEEWVQELSHLQDHYPAESERANMHVDFKGVHLKDADCLKLDQVWIQDKALHLLRYQASIRGNQ